MSTLDDVRFAGAEDPVQKLGKEVLTRVSLCLKLAAMHQLANAAMKPSVDALLACLVPAIQQQGSALRLEVVGENIFLNREVIKPDFRSYESAQVLRSIFKRLGIQQIDFTAAPTEETLRQFLATYQSCYQGQEPGKLSKVELAGVKVRALQKAHAEDGQKLDERQNLLRSYALLTVSLRESLAQLEQGKPARIARLRRAVHALANASVNHSSLLIGVTRMPGLWGEPHHHLAAVAAYSMLMARRVGLSRTALTEVCLAALFHDCARCEPGAAEGSDRLPLRSMLRVCAGGISADMLGVAAAAFECAQPASAVDPPGALARLIAVPCAFELLTAPKATERRGLPPDRAVRLLLDNAPSRFDPRAVTLFAATVGLYPVGTTVRLSSGELAMVLETPADPAGFATPRVKIVRGAAPGAVLDLASPGGPQITGTCDPLDEQVDVSQMLLA